MDGQFYTRQQIELFSRDLCQAFIDQGFEVVEAPHVDKTLYGFRATYIRRYLIHKPTAFYDGVWTGLVHVVGLPFGRQSQKMIVMSSPRNEKNEPIAETLKLRVHLDDRGFSKVMNSEKQTIPSSWPRTDKLENSGSPSGCLEELFRSQERLADSTLEDSSSQSHRRKSDQRFAEDLASYVAQIIDMISPGLIRLPAELKLEILKKLSVDSIIRMSQVNNEFKSLIFQQGEPLWRHLCERDFNIKSINRSAYRTWLELYRDTYLWHQVEILRKERALPGLPERPALPPAPYRLPIEWLPEVLELPFYEPHEDVLALPANNQLQLAIEMPRLRRAGSLDSIH